MRRCTTVAGVLTIPFSMYSVNSRRPLTLLAAWAVKRKDKLSVFFEGCAVEVWVWTAFSCYLLSQLIARRVFRYVYLPGEEDMHIFLEESVETMAHLVMIITCIVSWVRAEKSSPTQEK
ncbi:MAG: hypothetical protein FVQ82_01910 [Planctomycetes bacterium]|nr:hypothetical protein [Planctomycetota bacterium]